MNLADSDTASDEPVSETQGVSQRDAPVEQDKGSVLPLIFGGALACVLGFFGGQLDSVEKALGWGEDPGIATLEQALADQEILIQDQSDRILDLQTRLDELPPVPEPVDLGGVESGLSEQGSALEALEARLTELEKRPMTEGVSEDAIAAYEAELSRLQGTIESQRSEVEVLLEEARNSESLAERNARAALARAAMTRIVAAVESGAPFADAVAELQGASDVDIPEALSTSAAKGAPTLAIVQDGFPDAARAALSAARAEGDDAEGGGLGSFLQRQLGARSTTPQEGNSADAVLSRAEAAVRAGRIDEALAEIDALPEAGKAALSDWVSLATIRRDATLAVNDLTQALSAN